MGCGSSVAVDSRYAVPGDRPPASLMLLSDDEIVMILGFLFSPDLCRVAQTCRRLYALSFHAEYVRFGARTEARWRLGRVENGADECATAGARSVCGG